MSLSKSSLFPHVDKLEMTQVCSDKFWEQLYIYQKRCVFAGPKNRRKTMVVKNILPVFLQRQIANTPSLFAFTCKSLQFLNSAQMLNVCHVPAVAIMLKLQGGYFNHQSL